MLLSTEVTIKWVANNIKYYTDKGYKYTKTREPFTVKIEDLNPNSKYNVYVSCDYCPKVYQKSYKMYHRDRNNSNIKKDCCKDCVKYKREETMLEKYGVQFSMHVEEFKEKQKSTIIEKYGVEYVSQSAIVKEKIRETNLNKYGVVNASQLESVKQKKRETTIKNYGVTSPMKSEKIKQKRQNTIKEKYGVEHISQNEEIKKKIKETNLEKFGVESVLCLPENREKMTQAVLEKYGVKSVLLIPSVREKGMQTMYKNGTAPSSKQQRHVHSVVGGELNFNINKLFLDIAFVKDKTYLECDFRGHDLHVRLGEISQEEMDKKEQKRYYMLRDLGWKMIRIISLKDRVPSDKKLLEIIEIAKNELKNHSWIKFNLDNNSIETSSCLIYFDYGTLTKL